MARYTLDWSFGLVGVDGKYLTAEAFMGKLGTTAKTMKKKQIFFLKAGDDGAVAFRSWNDTYMRATDVGTVDCKGEEGDEETMFLIEPNADGTWALKSKKYGKYLFGTGEALTCFQDCTKIDPATKKREEPQPWTVHLAMHPQVALKHAKNNQYWGLDEAEGNSINCQQDLPWGHDATITIVTKPGTIQLQASNGGFLLDNGSLGDGSEANSEYVVVFEGEQVSFKGANGKFLSTLGGTGLVKASSASIGKDQRFIMEDSWPQVTFKSEKVGNLAWSSKGGVEISANAKAITDLEIFQLEPQADGTWLLKNPRGAHGAFVAAMDGGLTANGGGADEAPAAEAKFNVEFLGDSKVALKANDGKYLAASMNKQIRPTGGEVNADTTFVMEIINRPLIILRGVYGFIQAEESGLLRCNASVPQSFSATHTGAGYTYENWTTAADGSISIAAGSEVYEVQLLPESKMAISLNGKFLRGRQTGELGFTGDSIDAETQWEY